jgi:hypothetical protein
MDQLSLPPIRDWMIRAGKMEDILLGIWWIGWLQNFEPVVSESPYR